MKKLIALISLVKSIAIAAPYASGQGPYPVPFDPGSASLLNPPHIGVGQQQNVADSQHNQSGLNSSYLRIGGNGTQGIVRSLFCVPDINNNSNLFNNPQQFGLRIYTDCGAVTNLPAGNLTFDCSLAEILCNRYRFTTNTTNSPYSIVASTAFFDVITESTNSAYGTNITTFRLKLPVLFTNACVFQIYDYTNSRAWSNGYFGASYETGYLGFAYSNYRLRSASYVSSPTINTTNTLIDLSATPAGLLAGFTWGYLNLTNGDSGAALDTATPFFETSGSAIAWEPTGGDDMGLSTYSSATTGQFISWDWGVMDFWYYAIPPGASSTYLMEGYRWMLCDNFTWNNGLKVKFKPATAFNQYKLALFYYAP